MATLPTGEERPTKRPWLAALLSLFIPGLGQIYLREWIRSFLWFVTTMLILNLLLPQSVLRNSPGLDPVALLEWGTTWPLAAELGLALVTILAMVDAYFLAVKHNRKQTGEVGNTCPNCGKELDEDLEFCHWCSTELPGAADEEETAGEALAEDEVTSR